MKLGVNSFEEATGSKIEGQKKKEKKKLRYAL